MILHSIHLSAASSCWACPLGRPTSFADTFASPSSVRHPCWTSSLHWRMPKLHGYCCPSALHRACTMLCAQCRPLSPKSLQLLTTVPSCSLGLSLRSGTAAWVSAVPSGTRRLRIGFPGQTASSFLHAVSVPLLNACRRPWRAATRYHLPWTSSRTLLRSHHPPR